MPPLRNSVAPENTVRSAYAPGLKVSWPFGGTLLFPWLVPGKVTDRFRFGTWMNPFSTTVPLTTVALCRVTVCNDLTDPLTVARSRSTTGARLQTSPT